ncbi:MAG: glycosyltransferase family 9 protein, partial [Candidatus Omnitrophica bacterium]|nr:glycosyltransferase family 9 protein [Candidatus Omnitrophota bacterium]
RPAGLQVVARSLEFFVKQEDIKRVEDFLSGHHIREDDFIVGINPGGNWGPKRWPRENFAALADRIADIYRAKIIITGGGADEALAREIGSRMKTKPVIACGTLSLKQFAVLASISNLFITADSGPMHIANAVSCRRIIALFGPTDPALTGPFPPDRVTIVRKEIGCRLPCYKVDCADNRCMKAISVEDVVAAVRKVATPP